MRIQRLASSLLLGASLVACADLDLTNPNQPSATDFWRTAGDAQQAVSATYAGLLNNGTYGRWLPFANDLRSDIGLINSPWTDLSNFTKFSFTSYDFEVNREIWQHHYQAIFRANQVIANVPNVEMDAAVRDRYVAEAKFIRALLYYNLLVLYENIPLITAPPADPTERPATAQPADVWAQIEQDLTEASAVLPGTYSGADVGRATKGAALALLGKAQLQQRKWAEAAATLQQVDGTGANYALMENFADNFTDQFENNKESVFEVQFGGRSLLGSGVRGLNTAKMVGPCGPTYCDGRPTQWYFELFQEEQTTDGQPDPRLEATLFFNHPGDATYDVYGQPFVLPGEARRTPEAIWFKKWGEYYIKNNDQDWDAAINFRVIRYADVLLMRAEAVNEQGNPAAAAPFINQVRQRAHLADLPATLSVEEMRDRILRERALEFGLEAQRLADLKRHDLLTPALVAHDPEFEFFTAGKAERLPIPQTERDLNPNITQNPGW
jgi:starch-binding outer membrane protein, SusD/RagB family